MITRRKVIQGIGALGGAAAAGNGLASTDRSQDVIVIGAGLAGLYSATLLEEAGVRVTVLEGGSRIGGRVQSVRVDGETLDVGATGIGPTHGRTLDILRRFKLASRPGGGTLPSVFYVNGGLVTAEQWPSSSHNKLKGEERAIVPSRIDTFYLDQFNPFDKVDDWLLPEHAHLDIPLGQFLQQRGLSDEGLRLANVAINCADIWSTSTLPLLRDTAKWQQIGFVDAENEDLYSGGQYQPVACVGGNDRLAHALAGSLREPPQTNKIVGSIWYTSTGAIVECADGTRYEADKVIITVPLTALRSISFHPVLPREKHDLIRDAYYSGNTQFILRVHDKFWESDGLPPSLWTDTPIERVFATPDSTGEISTLRVWINGIGSRRIEQILPEHQPQYVLDLLGRIRPSTKGKLSFVHRQSWTTNQFFQGEKFFFSAGQVHRFAPHMATPVGPLHFAGAHHRHVDQGMEAALQSGERAALEIILNDAQQAAIRAESPRNRVA